MNDEKTEAVVTVPNDKLAAAIRVIARENRSGQLRVNFSQGSPAGGIQWIENLDNGKGVLAVD
jgi:hypothetical protein